jgi:Zn-dependent protease/predicted transcriptional regulator
MLKAKVKLGRIWNIPIGLDTSWFLIFGLITWSLAVGTWPVAYPGLSPITYWLMGGLTSLLFFGSVLAHELAHAFFALRNGIPVSGITLFFFGGVAQINQEPKSPGAEFRIAIAGPLSSLGLALLFWRLSILSAGVPYAAEPSIWLARTNLTLALFNMIPGFPLDGGRVLRALVWRFTGSFRQASQIAASIGVLSMFTGSLVNGLWLVFAGQFLQNAAASSQAQLRTQDSLRGVTVGQVMSRNCSHVSHLLPLSQLVEEQVLNGGQSCVLVTENGEVRGLLTLREITAVPRRHWRYVTAGEVMVPLGRLVRVEADAELVEALQTMNAASVAQASVVEDNRLVGMLSLEQVWRYLRLRSELGV